MRRTRRHRDGRGRGIGREHALEFARQGAKVVVNDLGVEARRQRAARRRSPAEEVVKRSAPSAARPSTNGADVADFAQAGELVKTAIDAFGGLDVVVNNAGFVRDRMFVSTSEDEWDAVVRVHLKGHFCVTAPRLRVLARARSKAGEPVDARIINTSSGAGLQGSVGQSELLRRQGGHRHADADPGRGARAATASPPTPSRPRRARA